MISKYRKCQRSVRYKGCKYCGTHYKNLKKLVKDALYTVKVGADGNFIQDTNHPVQIRWVNERGYSVFVKSLRKGEPIVFHEDNLRRKLRSVMSYSGLINITNKIK